MPLPCQGLFEIGQSCLTNLQAIADLLIWLFDGPSTD